MPKWLFWLALFFVLFLIYTQPGEAGSVAGSFGQFAVDLLDALGQFLSGLVDGASGESSTNGLDTSQLSDNTGSTTSPTISHSHGGGEVHTHGGD